MKKTNYHTHTFRCGHAVGDEEAMVKAAIADGIEELGFSDHIPLPHYRWHILKGMRYALNDFHALGVAIKTLFTNGPDMRMPYQQKELHLKTVKELKEKYVDQIKIYQGFEAEYFEEYLEYYQELLSSGEVDYLILGHHFNKYSIHSCYYGKNKITNQEIIEYKNDLLKAMDTDLFSYVAHPDLFMIGKVKFDEFCENITREICQKALEKDIPLEINAGGIRRGLRRVDDEMLYPYTNDYFFKIVGEMGCKVIIGIDGHSPNDFNSEIDNKLKDFIKKHNLILVDNLKLKKFNRK